jgi:arabinogalactan oligomer/maltooligosaccharide transport system permease protein
MTETLAPETDQKAPPQSPLQRTAARTAEAAGGKLRWLIAKIALLAIVDAVALYAVFVLFLHNEWLVLAVVAAVTVLVNWIYFSRR